MQSVGKVIIKKCAMFAVGVDFDHNFIVNILRMLCDFVAAMVLFGFTIDVSGKM